jgi:hypothetical protein
VAVVGETVMLGPEPIAVPVPHPPWYQTQFAPEPKVPFAVSVAEDPAQIVGAESVIVGTVDGVSILTVK